MEAGLCIGEYLAGALRLWVELVSRVDFLRSAGVLLLVGRSGTAVVDWVPRFCS